MRSNKRCNRTERFVHIQNAIKTNVEAAKRLLKQQNFRKFNTLKWEPPEAPKPTTRQTNRSATNREILANALAAGL